LKPKLGKLKEPVLIKMINKIVSKTISKTINEKQNPRRLKNADL
jgi:hypothetical protein